MTATQIKRASSTLEMPLAEKMAQSIVDASSDSLVTTAGDKVKICLIDLIGCAFEARGLPWSLQAKRLATHVAEGATIINARQRAAHGDAAFANAVMAHGLVREDMHSGSISHLGIVVLPALLALTHYRRTHGREFIAAAVTGYEVGGQIGRALLDAAVARIHRPTGITGPIAAAAASARLLGLNVAATTSALAVGGNAAMGFNQWAHTGGSEMFFQAGFAARNGITAAQLAEAGAFASPSALDGEAGLFAAFGKRANAARVALFNDPPEILSVYHKPVPACNFAQTASQAALKIARQTANPPENIVAITVRVPRAGMLYPGCDYRGPFAHILQAKMSIQYNVAAALVERAVTENNFARLDDPRVQRLLTLTTMEADADMTQAYPALQGGEVAVRFRDDTVERVRLDDVVNATPPEVRERFRRAVGAALGHARALEIESYIDRLEREDDVSVLSALLSGKD